VNLVLEQPLPHQRNRPDRIGEVITTLFDWVGKPTNQQYFTSKDLSKLKDGLSSNISA
jgi:hypothetical protein